MSLPNSTFDKALAIMAKYRNPALLVSFGKDSMAMLHMFRKLELPIICYRPPYLPGKWSFAESIIQSWELTVHNFPPAWIGLQGVGDALELVQAYSAGGNTVRCIQTHLSPSDTGLCGRHDLLGRPRGKMDHPWDLVLAAQKDGDADRLYGQIPVKLDVFSQSEGADVLFPLRHWSDHDVWSYLESNGVPIDETRYEYAGGDWRERPSHNTSNDWLPACTRCLDRDGPPVVKCPRLGGAEIPNISAQVNYLDKRPPSTSVHPVH